MSASISASPRRCVPPLNPVADLLADLAAVFTALGTRWYVFGAQAALIWGRPRLTTDVDATVDLGGHPVAQLIDALRGRGFALRAEGTPDFITSTRVVPLHHDRSGLATDVVLAGPGLEVDFLARAVQIDIGGVAVPFISPEDLIVTKMIAGRPKDLDDVRGILAQRGQSLDRARVVALLRAIEDALGRSDLVEAFNPLMADAVD
jgi:hypothetical protein